MTNLKIASNPDTSPEKLEQLSKNKCWIVRGCVAENPNTSLETIKKLAKDENFVVRFRVERNPNASREVLLTKRAYEFLLDL